MGGGLSFKANCWRAANSGLEGEDEVAVAGLRAGGFGEGLAWFVERREAERWRWNGKGVGRKERWA